ncbi:MAG: hypothetical protein M1379_12230 [Firmicutes bacterium]|nr:hypothetical protein [Bacillota bacterium]
MDLTGMTATVLHPIKDEDMAVAVVRFATGALGYVETGWHSHPGFGGIEVYGSEGTMIHDYAKPPSSPSTGSVPGWCGPISIEKLPPAAGWLWP